MCAQEPRLVTHRSTRHRHAAKGPRAPRAAAAHLTRQRPHGGAQAGGRPSTLLVEGGPCSSSRRLSKRRIRRDGVTVVGKRRRRRNNRASKAGGRPSTQTAMLRSRPDASAGGIRSPARLGWRSAQLRWRVRSACRRAATRSRVLRAYRPTSNARTRSAAAFYYHAATRSLASRPKGVGVAATLKTREAVPRLPHACSSGGRLSILRPQWSVQRSYVRTL